MNASLHQPRPLLNSSPPMINRVVPAQSTPAPKAEQASNTDTAADATEKLSLPVSANAFIESLETRSTLLTKLDPALRSKIHELLLNHEPPTYREVFDLFALRQKNVSFTAFYHYARRIRAHAAIAESAQAMLPDGANLDELLPEMLASRLLETLMDESSTPQTIHRLVDAFRAAASVNFTRRRLDAQLLDVRREKDKKETRDIIDALRQSTRLEATTFAAAMNERASQQPQPERAERK